MEEGSPSLGTAESPAESGLFRGDICAKQLSPRSNVRGLRRADDFSERGGGGGEGGEGAHSESGRRGVETRSRWAELQY